MRWYTHLLFGLLVAILVLPFVENSYLFTVVVLFSALLPDVDHKDARIHRYVPFTRWVQLVFDHRGVFHSLLIPALLFSLLYSFGYIEVGMAVVLGYCSHLIIDSLTPHGVFPLYPLTSVHVKGFMKVGGLWEMVMVGLMLGGLVVWGLS